MYRLVLIALIIAFFLSACSRSPEKTLLRANELAEQGNWKEADVAYRSVLQRQPNNAEAFYRLGLLRSKQKLPIEAFQAMDQAAKLDPGLKGARDAVLLTCLTSYWLDPKRPQHLYERLKRLSDEGLKRDQSDFVALKVKGYLSLTENRVEEARDWFLRAHRAKPEDVDSLAMYAQALFRTGASQQAVQEIRQFIQSQPAQPLPYNVLYSQLMADGKAPEAEDLLRLMIEKNPRDLQPKLLLAAHFRRIGRMAESEQIVAELLDNRVLYPNATALVGEFFMQAGVPDRALAILRQAISQNPSGAVSSRQQLIFLLLAAGKNTEAMAELSAATKAHPNDRTFQSQLAVLRFSTEGPTRLAETVAQLKSAVEAKPDDTMLRLTLAKLFREQGDFLAARKELDQILRSRPNNVEALLVLSSIGIDSGDTLSALKAAEQAASIAPENRNATLAKAVALRGQRRFGEARGLLAGLKAGGYPPAVIDVELAYNQLLEGDLSGAERTFRKVHSTIPGVRSAAGLAEALTRQSKVDEALSVLEQQDKRTPGQPVLIFGQAECLVRKGEFSRALVLYETLAKEAPSVSPARLRIAQVCLALGDIAKAKDSANQLLKSGPDDLEARLVLADSLSAESDFSAAERLYREILQKDASNPLVSNNLADILAKQEKDLDGALRFARSAVQSSPQQPSFQDTLAFVLLKKGQTAEALSIFRKIVAQSPLNATYQYHLGLSLAKQGDTASARKSMEHALKLNCSARLRAEIEQALKQL